MRERKTLVADQPVRHCSRSNAGREFAFADVFADKRRQLLEVEKALAADDEGADGTLIAAQWVKVGVSFASNVSADLNACLVRSP